MKKIALNLAVFLCFGLSFYSTCLFLWKEHAPAILSQNIAYPIGSAGHTYSRLSEVKNYQDIDILFLGSSHAYRGFDTRIFEAQGYKSFNLGSSSQTPTQTKVLVERYIDALNPKIVVYEAYPATFALDGVESSLDLIANDQNDWLSIKMALQSRNIKVFNTLLYSLMRELLGLNKGFSEARIKGNDTYVDGGFVEKKLAFHSPAPIMKKPVNIIPEQQKKFTEIIQLIKERNIKLYLVSAPVTKGSHNSHTYQINIDSLMHSYPGQYLDFNHLLSLDDSLHFYDSHHLNQHGVRLFNRQLIEHLRNNP